MPRILLVDDDASAGLRLRRELERAGHSVVIATSAADARRSLSAIDVVLTNIYMPQKDGLDFIRTIHSAAPDLRVIALSGGPSWQGASQQEAIGPAGPDVQALALEFGAWRVLPVPFDWSALERAIDEALHVSESGFDGQHR
jgi:DNA-binding NtrC family response regulator